MSIIVLAILLIWGGASRILPALMTPPLNIVYGIAMVVCGILFLLHI